MKWPWPNLIHYPCHFPEGLRKTMKIFSQYSQFWCRDLKAFLGKVKYGPFYEASQKTTECPPQFFDCKTYGHTYCLLHNLKQ
jgi:hypothetical protein